MLCWASAGGLSSNDELLDALLTGAHMPGVSDGSWWTHFRGHRYMDGGKNTFCSAPAAAAAPAGRALRPSLAGSCWSETDGVLPNVRLSEPEVEPQQVEPQQLVYLPGLVAE